jgi:chromosome partitioning protein
MEVLVFASRKGGSGKSTLTAHLAAHAHKPARRCLLIDTDPQGSLALWHRLRLADGAGDDLSLKDLPLKTVHRNIADAVKEARREGFDWVFIDTAPNVSASVIEAMRTATLVVVPCRPGVFDLEAVKETLALAREARKPYAVVINGAAPKRQDVESRAVAQARESLRALHIPVWGGQITQRANFSTALAEGEGAKEYDSHSSAAAEIARLWLGIERSVKAIHGAREAGGMHKAAA